MPLGPVAMVREAFARWQAGDYDRLLEFMLANSSPDVEVHSLLGLVEGEPYEGHAGIRTWVGDIQANFEHFAPWHDELREVGPDRVVAMGGIRFRARESGVEMEVPWGWVFEFGDGQLRRLLFYGSPAEALAAVGLTA